MATKKKPVAKPAKKSMTVSGAVSKVEFDAATKLLSDGICDIAATVNNLTERIAAVPIVQPSHILELFTLNIISADEVRIYFGFPARVAENDNPTPEQDIVLQMEAESLEAAEQGA